MQTQIPCRIGAAAIAVLLIAMGGAVASPVNDLPELPFDQVTGPSGDFASFASPSTPVDPSIDPTAGSGQPSTEESPEPATLSLLSLGGLGAWWHLRRRKAEIGRGID